MPRNVNNVDTIGLTTDQAAEITANTAAGQVISANTNQSLNNLLSIATQSTNTSAISTRITHLTTFPTFVALAPLVSDYHSGLSNAVGFPAATISNGFKAGSGAFPNDLVAEVQMRGCLGCSGILNNTILFKLPTFFPSDYTPNRTIRITTPTNMNSANGSIQIEDDGTVKYIGPGASPSLIFPDGVRYYTK